MVERAQMLQIGDMSMVFYRTFLRWNTIRTCYLMLDKLDRAEPNRAAMITPNDKPKHRLDLMN